jgi:DNA-binding MarR family transcriptional regulator
VTRTRDPIITKDRLTQGRTHRGPSLPQRLGGKSLLIFRAKLNVGTLGNRRVLLFEAHKQRRKPAANNETRVTWDMLLDLTAAHAEGQKVSVTSLCIAANVPATTALRWLSQMVEAGVFRRAADPMDRRRVFIELSDASITAMAGYFAALDEPLAFAA